MGARKHGRGALGTQAQHRRQRPMEVTSNGELAKRIESLIRPLDGD